MKKLLTIIILCFVSISIYGQEKMLRGVLEDKGEPLLFATVAVYRDGLLVRGTETDLDGKYAILCMLGDEIETSYIGYSPKRFTVTNSMLSGYQSSMSVKVNPHLSKSYSKLVAERKSKWNDKNRIIKDTQPKTYQVQNYHGSYQSIGLFVGDGKLKFVKPKKTLRFSIDVKQTNGVSYIQNRNLHDLQTQFAQGRPVNGVLSQMDYTTGEQFSWGPKIDQPKHRNNIINSSIFSATNVKLDVLKGNNRIYFSFARKNESDIFNVGNQGLTTGKIGAMRYRNDGGILIGEISFGLSNMNNHNAGGYYQNVLKSMMVQSPSFDSATKDGTQFVSYSNKFNNPRWLLENNSNELTKSNVGIFIQHKNSRSYSTKYSNALKLEMDFFDVNEIAAPGTIGNFYGANRMLDYFYPKANLVSNFKKRIHDNDKAHIYANNFIEAEYLRFRSIDTGAQDFTNALYRSSLQIGYIFNPEPYKFDIAYQPIFSSLQTTDWLSSKIDFTYFINANKKYLDDIEMIFSFNRKAKNQELFLSRNNYSSQTANSYTGLGATYDIPLFLPSDLKNEVSQTTRIGISLINKYHSNSLQTSFVYRNLRQSNVIFPIEKEGEFILRNVGDFNTNALEWRSYVRLRSYSKNLSYIGQLNIVKYSTKVTRVSQNENDVIISGFANVSKQFIIDQPIGVIVGSDYRRNNEGELIIGEDGFPKLNNKKVVIGDPTPWFVGEIKHKISKGNFYITLNIDGQLGGQIWNGTQQALDYYGVSQYTAEQRENTDYIFDGVDEFGNINTKSVSLADPSLGIEGNRWTRYGTEGVSSDYIVDASYLRIKRIALGYTKRLENRKEINFKLFATNLFTLAPFAGYTSNYLFEDDLSNGLQYFNQPMTTQIGFSIHLKI